MPERIEIWGCPIRIEVIVYGKCWVDVTHCLTLSKDNQVILDTEEIYTIIQHKRVELSKPAVESTRCKYATGPTRCGRRACDEACRCMFPFAYDSRIVEQTASRGETH